MDKQKTTTSQPMAKKLASGYIAGPVTDMVFLIAAPLVALAIYLLMTLDPLMLYDIPGDHPFRTGQILSVFSLVVIYSHLFIVFFRSHVNTSIFKKHKIRFTLIPVALFAAVYFSTWALAAVTIVSVWWDVYHSSMQTFGIGRIYDKLQGNDALLGRRLDILLNLLLYAGPVVGGVVLMDHLVLHEVSTKTFPVLEQALFQVSSYQIYITYGLLAIGLPFCIYYVYSYWRFARQGYTVSFQKVALLVILTLTSLLCWGLNSFGGAFFVMNFFHAFQYFFLVWFLEKKNITSFFRMGNLPQGEALALGVFVFVGIGYGVWSQTKGAFHFSEHAMICILLVISILHFWYDGFIWSVRRNEV